MFPLVSGYAVQFCPPEEKQREKVGCEGGGQERRSHRGRRDVGDRAEPGRQVRCSQLSLQSRQTDLLAHQLVLI